MAINQDELLNSDFGMGDSVAGDTTDYTTYGQTGETIEGEKYPYDSSTVTDAVTSVPETNAPVEETEAYDLMKDMLSNYGLESLLPKLVEWVQKDYTIDQMIVRLKDTDEFKDRFYGMQLREDAELNAISIDQYISNENQYRQVMMEYGIPSEFYEPSDLAQLIGNDVSPKEVEERVELAAQAVANVDPNLKSELARLYGIGGDGDSDIIAYYIDPDRAVTVFESRNQMTAASLSSAAMETVGKGGLSKSVAERLASKFYQPMQISERLATSVGLTEDTFSTKGVTTSELAASAFALDPESIANIRRLRDRRSQTKQKGLGGLVQQQGAIGLGATQN
tara:strand:- start:82 stop:1092 length:1011 start_codon:yes stop_codon:yes gene_type:complete